MHSKWAVHGTQLATVLLVLVSMYYVHKLSWNQCTSSLLVNQTLIINNQSINQYKHSTALAFYFIDKPTESLPSFQSMYPWCLNSNSQHTLLTTGQRKISRCSKNREINSRWHQSSVQYSVTTVQPIQMILFPASSCKTVKRR